MHSADGRIFCLNITGINGRLFGLPFFCALYSAEIAFACKAKLF